MKGNQSKTDVDESERSKREMGVRTNGAEKGKREDVRGRTYSLFGRFQFGYEDDGDWGSRRTWGGEDSFVATFEYIIVFYNPFFKLSHVSREEIERRKATPREKRKSGGRQGKTPKQEKKEFGH